MNSKLLSILAGLLLTSSAFGKTSAQVAAYKKEGKVIMDMILTKKIDVEKVKKAAIAMSDSAAELTKTYIQKYPKGKKMLEMTIKELPRLKGASFDEIEKQWHDLGYFNGKDVGMDITDEDNEHFTDPLHCMVHPLLTLRAAEDYAKDKNAKHIQTMKEELSEGLEQMDGVADKLK